MKKDKDIQMLVTTPVVDMYAARYRRRCSAVLQVLSIMLVVVDNICVWVIRSRSSRSCSIILELGSFYWIRSRLFSQGPNLLAVSQISLVNHWQPLGLNRRVVCLSKGSTFWVGSFFTCSNLPLRHEAQDKCTSFRYDSDINQC